MQLGGSWVGAVDPKDLPVEMEVDWVRFISESHSNKTLNMNIQLPSFFLQKGDKVVIVSPSSKIDKVSQKRAKRRA